MKFYSALAKYYDQVFPFEESIGSFLHQYLTEKQAGQVNLLDIACGTGTYAAYLAESGIRIIGLDADPEMISEASAKFNKSNLEFVTGDMLNLQKILGKRKFDMAYCIGNSIVHLKNERAIELFLDQCSGIMKIGGTLIIQIINFDRILEQNINALPTLNNRDIEFMRNYKLLDNGYVSFDTRIKTKRDGKSFSNSISLIALKKNRLIKLLEHSGFSIINIFGSYSKERWSKKSFLTIVEAAAIRTDKNEFR